MTPTMLRRTVAATTALMLLKMMRLTSAAFYSSDYYYLPVSLTSLTALNDRRGRSPIVLLGQATDTPDDTLSPARAASSLPRRRRKASKKKKKRSSPEGPISEEEIAQHVSQLYLHGPGGILRETIKRRERESAFGHNQEHLKQLDKSPALLLNADYQPMNYLPLSIMPWQETVKSVFSGKVVVVDTYPDVTIRAATLELALPSVVALVEYVPQFEQTPAFTKRNVFLRDEYRCQYCNQRFHTRDLSLDHVVPRCLGGRLVWQNTVTACHDCNGRKGSKSIKELKSVGMRLQRQPRIPTQYELASVAGRMLPRTVHPTWEPFLGMVSTTTEDGAMAAEEMLKIARQQEASVEPSA